MDDLVYVRKGPLLKRGEGKLGKMQWKPKMVVLTADGALLYCASQEKVTSQPSSIGHIDLRESDIDISEKRKYCFVITTKKKRHYFQAPNAETCLLWFDDIKLVIDTVGGGGRGGSSSRRRRRTIFQPLKLAATPSLDNVTSAMPIGIKVAGSSPPTPLKYQSNTVETAATTKSTTSSSESMAQKSNDGELDEEESSDAGVSDDDDGDDGTADLETWRQLLSVPSRRGASYDILKKIVLPSSPTGSMSSRTASTSSGSSSSRPPSGSFVPQAYDGYGVPAIMTKPKQPNMSFLSQDELEMLQELTSKLANIQDEQTVQQNVGSSSATSAALPPSVPTAQTPPSSVPQPQATEPKHKHSSSFSVNSSHTQSAAEKPNTQKPSGTWMKYTPKGAAARHTIDAPRIGSQSRMSEDIPKPMDKNSFAFVHFIFSPYASPIKTKSGVIL